MKNINIRNNALKFFLLALAFTLSGCVKEEFDDCPETGEITLTTQWNNRAPHVAVPERYNAVIGTYSESLAGLTNTLDHGFAPGNYQAYVYNNANGVSVSGSTVSVANAGAGINNAPDFLFTWTGEVNDLKMGENRNILAPMKQQVGEIYYEIVMEDGSDITDFVSSINEVTVNGIASRFDMKTGVHSNASAISPVFTLGDNKYVANSRILGTVGTTQYITIKYEMTTGGPGELTLTKNISSFLDGFNENKTGAYHVLVIMLMNNTPGQLTLETTWANKSADAAIPASYYAKIGSYSGALSGSGNLIDYDFAPGDHHVNVYNTPASFGVENMYATVNPDGDGILAIPDYLFSYTGDVMNLNPAEQRTHTAPMTQQVGTVAYRIVMANNALNVNDYISAVSANLGGIASRINLETGALSFPSSIAPVFSVNGLTRSATSRILGTIGASQMLTLEITLSGGGTQTLTMDTATILSGFNTNKLGTYNIVIEIESVDGLTGEILAWTVGGDYTGDID